MYPFKTEINRVFFAHWNSFRVGAALPLLKDFLSRPEPRVQSNVVIKDIAPNRKVHVRLHGTRLVELAGADLTGQDLIEYSDTPQMADDLWTFQRAVVDHPTGFAALKHTVTSSGRKLAFEELSLPAVPFPGGLPCVIGCFALLEEAADNDTVSHVLTYSDAVWLDIGWGVPGREPPKTARADLRRAVGG